tara:strand:- start:23409 stop:24038 length:630 start_codon:yes stop_codon:yes gene_type:complete
MSDTKYKKYIDDLFLLLTNSKLKKRKLKKKIDNYPVDGEENKRKSKKKIIFVTKQKKYELMTEDGTQVDELNRILKDNFNEFRCKKIKDIEIDNQNLLKMKYNLLFEYNDTENAKSFYENKLLPLEKSLDEKNKELIKLDTKYNSLYDKLNVEINNCLIDLKNSSEILKEAKQNKENIIDLMKDYIENQSKLYKLNEEKILLEKSILEI